MTFQFIDDIFLLHQNVFQGFIVRQIFNFSIMCFLFFQTLHAEISVENPEAFLNEIVPPVAETNPFTIPFGPKTDLDNQDYLTIQEQIRAIDIYPLISKLYPDNQGYTPIHDFLGRCSKGVSQILIDENKGYLPTKRLIKIGEGSDNCFVCCVPYDGIRDVLLDKIINELQLTGFNGYFYYRKGGFPNPTGSEIQYVGVPYCFKIFMMLEAQNLGFNKVIWVDSACLPVRDPSYLFYWLDHCGALLNGWCNFSSLWRYILPSTWEVLKDLTGSDVLQGNYVHTRVFGLKMDCEPAKKLIKEYYQFVELGIPFLSCYPEEFVLTALLGKSDYNCWGLYPFEIIRAGEGGEVISEVTEQARNQGYFFYQMQH